METAWVQFELSVPTATAPLRVRLRDLDERWVASVHCGSLQASGIGVSAREALVAALSPFGTRVTSAVMAAPAMFAASAQLLMARAAM